jgi:hypothetical protein
MSESQNLQRLSGREFTVRCGGRRDPPCHTQWTGVYMNVGERGGDAPADRERDETGKNKETGLTD